jgi:ornithine carbamoyltransferase
MPNSQHILELSQKYRDYTASNLSELVRINSPSLGEKAVAAKLADLMQLKNHFGSLDNLRGKKTAMTWAPYHVMEKRTELLRSKDTAGLKELEKDCLANNARFKDWECNEEKMKLTRKGQALYMHCLPADISGASCAAGEVAAAVFERYRIPTYIQAGFKPYVIAAVMLAARFADPVKLLRAMKRRTSRRIGL